MMRRPFFLIAITALAATTCGQWGVALEKAVGDARQRQTTPVEGPPREIAGTSSTSGQGLEQAPTTPTLQDQLPPPATDIQQRFTFDAENYRRDGTKVYLSGNVVVTYKGYRLTGDVIEGDLSTGVFVMKGRARVESGGDDVVGQDITVDLNNETYTVTGGVSRISPETLGNVVTGPFYVSAGRGSLVREHFHVENGRITSCDLPHPHYEIGVGEADALPGRYLRMRDVALYIQGRKIFSIPHLYVPLYRDRPRYLPEVGQSPDEGYFIKSRYTTPLGGDDTLDARLDLMSKLGVGIGGDYNYLNDTLAGGLSVYSVVNRRTLLVNWIHDQLWGRSRFSADTRYAKNNYLTAPNTTTLNSRAQLSVPGSFGGGAGNTQFNFYRSSSDVSTFSTVNQNFGVTDTRTWGTGMTTSLSSVYSTNRSVSSGSTLSESQRVDLRFSASQPFRSFRTDLLYNRAIPVGNQEQFGVGTEQTPLVTVSTDDVMLFGYREGSARSRSWLPFNTAFSIGELKDPGVPGGITRSTFEFSTRGQNQLERRTYNPETRLTNQRGTTLDYTGQLLQGFYSDDTAQYALNYGAALRHTFGLGSSFELRYQSQRQHGYTPLAIDRRYRTDSFNTGLNMQFGRGWTASASTGYDILLADQGRVPWQLVNLRTEYRNGQQRFDFASVYDTFNTSFSYFRATGQTFIGDTFLSAGVRYDALRSTWAAATLEVQGFRWGRLTTDFLLSYNGYSKQFDARQLRLTWDMHCTEAILEITDYRAGFRPGTQIALFVRIKALPFNTDFGTGRRGQRVGGVGGFGG